MKLIEPKDYAGRRSLNRLRHRLTAPLETIEQAVAAALASDKTLSPECADQLGTIRTHALDLVEQTRGLLSPEQALESEADEQTRTRRAIHDLKNALAQIGYRCEDLLQDAPAGTAFALLLEEIDTNYRECLAQLRAGTEISDDQSLPATPRPQNGDVGLAAITGRILVVDDQQFHRDHLGQLLTQQGHSVVLAESGEQTLKLLDHEMFDLVLLDLNMEGRSGYEVLREIKSDPGMRTLPVVLVSAIDDVDDIARCISSGADDYLPKPVDFRLLQARVGSCLARNRLQKQHAQQIAETERHRKRTADLLNRLFPHGVVQELLATQEIQPETVRPRSHTDIAVMFCDVVGFTAYCDSRDPGEVIPRLRKLFNEFEQISQKHGVQKIKTIGDCFMSVSGVESTRDNAVLDCLHAGVEMVAAAPKLCDWQVRVGISFGPVVSGIAGQSQFCFDLWGDTVNLAARVQGRAEPSEIVMTSKAWSRIESLCKGESSWVELRNRGEVEIVRFRRFRKQG